MYLPPSYIITGGKAAGSATRPPWYPFAASHLPIWIELSTRMDALNLFSWVAGSSLCAVGNAARTNRTIDDTYGDSVTGALPTYTPPVDWTAGQNCSDCLVAPRDLSQVLNGTWHDTSQFYTSDTEHRITVTFSGKREVAVKRGTPTKDAHARYFMQGQPYLCMAYWPIKWNLASSPRPIFHSPSTAQQ